MEELEAIIEAKTIDMEYNQIQVFMNYMVTQGWIEPGHYVMSVTMVMDIIEEHKRIFQQAIKNAMEYHKNHPINPRILEHRENVKKTP